MKENFVDIEISIPRVTVGLAVFNGGHLLEAAVQSILDQSLQDWQLLLIDDGSTDGCIDHLKCLNDPRVIVLRDGLNLGHASRLNQAIQMTKSKYFARMDQDDVCHSDRFARQVEFLESHPNVDLLATKCLAMDELGNVIKEIPSSINHNEICRYPWRGFYMPHPSWMGKIEWFRRYRYKYPAPYCCEDQELLLRAHRTSIYHTLDNINMYYRVKSEVNLKKELKTTWALYLVKVSYFAKRGEVVSLLLSSFVSMGRFCTVVYKSVIR